MPLGRREDNLALDLRLDDLKRRGAGNHSFIQILIQR